MCGSFLLKLQFIWNSGDQLVNYERETARKQRANKEGLEKFSICITMVSYLFQSILREGNSHDSFSCFFCLFYERASLVLPA